mgnify:CR=1 FL=1
MAPKEARRLFSAPLRSSFISSFSLPISRRDFSRHAKKCQTAEPIPSTPIYDGDPPFPSG